jgi:hypothetical protein
MSTESDAKYVSEIVKKMMDRVLGQTKEELKENIDPLNDVVNNLKSMFEKPDEESKSKESKAKEELKEEEPKENPVVNTLGNILKELVNQTMDQMDKLDQEQLEENRQFFPRFTKLYDSWKFSEVSELPSKPVPVWDHVDPLEAYLYGAVNEDKSEVSKFFLSQVWKDFKDESYLTKVCAIVQKIFPHEFMGVQHHFALHVVNHLTDALKPNLDNVA